MILDPFLLYALLGGIGIAIVAGPLGCFVVWQRMAYFGDSLAHSALLGIVLGMLSGLNLNIGIFIVCVLFAMTIILLQQKKIFAFDTLLGILAHSSLSIGIIGFALLQTVRLDLFSYLFGDILSITLEDLIWIYAGGLVVLLCITTLWRSLLLTIVDSDLAKVEGIRTTWVQIGFMLLMAFMIATAIHIVGVLLITSLLVIPAATARYFSKTPEQMVVIASSIGILTVIIGIFSSVQWDIPSGPAIVVTGALLFLVSTIFTFTR